MTESYRIFEKIGIALKHTSQLGYGDLFVLFSETDVDAVLVCIRSVQSRSRYRDHTLPVIQLRDVDGRYHSGLYEIVDVLRNALECVFAHILAYYGTIVLCTEDDLPVSILVEHGGQCQDAILELCCAFLVFDTLGFDSHGNNMFTMEPILKFF